MKRTLRSWVPRLIVSAAAVFFASLCAHAQTTATLSGSVLDPSLAALPRATVRLLDLAGTEINRKLADSQGRFRFENLPAPNYTVEASLTGFQTRTVTAHAGSDVEIVLPLDPVRENIVVTATRTETPTSQIGTNTSVLTENEITPQQKLLVSQLLQSVPGVMIVRTGGFGNVTSVFIRGGESDYNKVLLDGIPLNEPGGVFEFSNIMAEDLERIEVVRGPQSALFGSDAMASVIQLFTHRGKAETRRPHISLAFEAGKFQTLRGRAGVGGQVGKFDYSVNWARLETDNQEPNNAFHNTTLSSNLGLALGKNTTVRLILRGNFGRAGTPGQTAFGRPDRDAFFRKADGYSGFAVHNQTTSQWEQRFTYTFARSRQVSRDLIEDPPFVPTFEGRVAQCPDPVTGIIGPCLFFDFLFDFLNDTRRHHIGYQSDFQAGSGGRAIGKHIFTFAFEWDREQGFIADRLFGEAPTRAERDNFGGTFQHQVVWGRASLSNGLRVEDNASFGRTVVPRSSAAYLLRQGGGMFGTTKLKFNFGLGIKEPTFIESFSPSPFFQGNPQLRPERARSFDFGIEQRFWKDRAKLEVNWFDNRFRELIAFRTVSFSPFRASFFNIARTKAKGAEVIVEVAPGSRLRVFGSYTFLDSEITRSASPFSPVFREGQSLFRRPRHSGSIRLFYNWRGLNITSSAFFVGPRVDSDLVALQPPITENKGYIKWDLAWSYRSSYKVTYLGVVENLLSREYMEALGFPALKLTYRVGARVDF